MKKLLGIVVLGLLLSGNANADDFVVASGKTYAVRDFCNITFKKLGLMKKLLGIVVLGLLLCNVGIAEFNE